MNHHIIFLHKSTEFLCSFVCLVGWLIFGHELAEGFAEYNSGILNGMSPFVQNFIEPLAYSGLSGPEMRIKMPLLKVFQEN